MHSAPTSPSGSSASTPRPVLETVRTWRQEAFALARQAPLLTALLGMALLGFAISAYLTSVHYAGVRLVCSTGGIVNCGAVTSSAYSVIPGTQIPITIPGMLWFAVSGALAIVGLVALRRGESEPERLRLAHVIWGALGLAFVFYLVYAELVKLHSICEWCTTVHILTLLTFFVALYRLQQQMSGEDALERPAPARQATKNGAGYRANDSSRQVASGPSVRTASTAANGHRSGSRTASRATGPRSANRSSSSRRKR